MYRKYRPYAVFSFDPYATYEPNLDHVRVAQAVEEGFWVSNFKMVRNTIHQLQLQLNTWGRRGPAVDQALQGEFFPLVDQSVRENAKYVAGKYGLADGKDAEVFRVNRFGAWESRQA